MSIDAKTATETTLAIEIARDQDDLTWKVKNATDHPVWAFLLVSTVKNGALSFAEDAAWLETDADGTLLVRKIDTPIPDDVDVDDRIRSGAVLLKPGDVKSGRIHLGATVKLRVPYRSAKNKVVPVTRVLFEVGWLPVGSVGLAGEPKLLNADGHEFAYLQPEREPGGQRFARSAPLPW